MDCEQCGNHLPWGEVIWLDRGDEVTEMLVHAVGAVCWQCAAFVRRDCRLSCLSDPASEPLPEWSIDDGEPEFASAPAELESYAEDEARGTAVFDDAGYSEDREHRHPVAQRWLEQAYLSLYRPPEAVPTSLRRREKTTSAAPSTRPATPGTDESGPEAPQSSMSPAARLETTTSASAPGPPAEEKAPEPIRIARAAEFLSKEGDNGEWEFNFHLNERPSPEWRAAWVRQRSLRCRTDIVGSFLELYCRPEELELEFIQLKKDIVAVNFAHVLKTPEAREAEVRRLMKALPIP
jgi:hypothetical protein